MKQLILISIAIVIGCFGWTEKAAGQLNPRNLMVPVEYFAGGTGTSSDPYLISTAQQLSNLREAVGPNYADTYFKITDDLHMYQYCLDYKSEQGGQGDRYYGWIPIGLSDNIADNTPANINNAFCGHLDGGGHLIEGIFLRTLDASGQREAGLFAALCGAEIKNLGIITSPKNTYVWNMPSSVGIIGIGGSTGIIAGKIIENSTRETILECCFTEGVVSYSHSATNGCGGLIGRSEGNMIISNCYSTAHVCTKKSDSDVGSGFTLGGLVGKTSASDIIQKSYSAGIVEGFIDIGGLVGINCGEIIYCSANNPQLRRRRISGINIAKSRRLIGETASICGTSSLSNNYALSSMNIRYNYTSESLEDSKYDSTTIQSTLDDLNTFIGLDKSKETLEQSATYRYGLDWDFDNIWRIDPNYEVNYREADSYYYPSSYGNYKYPIFDWQVRCTNTVKYTWTPQSGSENWNDPLNWVPNGIPTKCDDVVIDSDRGSYPDIKVGDNATCRYITFNSDKSTTIEAEVEKTYLLVYEKAFVNLTVPDGQWMTLSPSLASTYSGDYFILESFDTEKPEAIPRWNPSVWSMLYQTTNPEREEIAARETTWSNAYNTVHVPFPAGMGFAVFVGKAGFEGLEPTFHFPSDSTFYYYYDQHGKKTGKRDPTEDSSLDRSKIGRFIYETANKVTPEPNTDPFLKAGHFVIDVKEEIAASNTAIVGNPFMGHLDFFKFRDANMVDANTHKIGESYYTWNGNSFEATLLPDRDNMIITNGTNSSGLIPPMTSFIITKNNETDLLGQLTFTPEMTVLKSKGATIPSPSPAPPTPDHILRMQIKRDGEIHSGIAIRYEEGVDNTYDPKKDVYTMFAENINYTAVLYSPIDGKAASIRTVGDLSQAIELGVSTTTKGELCFAFDGLDEFDPDYRLFLEDRTAGQEYSLSDNFEYTFNNTTGNIIGRFFLKAKKSGTDMRELDVRQPIVISRETNGFLVYAPHNERILRIECYTIQGQRIASATDIRSNLYHIPLLIQNQHLIIRVVTDKQCQTLKTN